MSRTPSFPRPGGAPAPRHVIGRDDRPGPVLVAIDERARSRALVRTGVLVGARLGAAVELVSVVAAPARQHGNVSLGLEPAPLTPAERALRESRVGRGAADLGDDLPVVVTTGSVPRALTTVAHERRASLLVVGRTEPSRIGVVGRGGLAARVIRLSTCPVLAVRGGWTSAPRRVMTACDFSLPALWAAELAGRVTHPEGQLDVVHVVPPDRDGPHDVATSGRYRDWWESHHAALRRLLAGSSDVAVHPVLSAGDAATQLLAEADLLDATLLAFGTSGSGALGRFFVGSVASELLELADRDLLVAPMPPAGLRDRLAGAVGQQAAYGDPREFAQAMDAFSTRHDGRRVWVESLDPARGEVRHETHARLRGISYEPASRRVLLMLGGDEASRVHVTHVIERPGRIVMHADGWGRESGLGIWHAGGLTEVRFVRDPA